MLGRQPDGGVSNRRVVIAVLLLTILLAAHGAVWLVSSIFEPLQAQTIDRLFLLRSRFASLKPSYDGTVFLVPIDDESLQIRESYYIGREDYARLVQNLSRAGVAAQFLDVIFAAPESEAGDRAMASAVEEAGNAYLGMAIGLSLVAGPAAPAPPSRAHREILDRRHWSPEVHGDIGTLLGGTRYFMTLPEIARPARGIGFLDLVPDRDGAVRRVPLLARDRGGLIPGLPLLVICDFLGVAMDDVRIEPGRSLTLPGARRPGSHERRDIVVPIDDRGQMIVNFVGPWGTLDTYPLRVVYEASDDRFTMEDLREELRGRIAIISWFSTGRGDVGAVPTDPIYPYSGVWACAMNTILSGEFVRELGGWGMLVWVEIPLVALLFAAGTRLSTVRYVGSAVGILLLYLSLVAVVFFGANLILSVPVPLLVLIASTPAIAAYQYHLEAEARARMHRELAVAREIQIGTLPRMMPEIDGYDVAGESVPADETGGDSFDAFSLKDGRLMVLLGDATGHGIGPALSVTQVRAMLRVAVRLEAELDQIVTHINEQLCQDLSDNRFITAFLGVLDPRTHRVEHHSAGQAPLLHFHAGSGECEWLGSSTRALGMFPGLSPKAKSLMLGPGDILGLMTDGVFDQENAAEEPFGKDRVAEVVRRSGHGSMSDLCHAIYRELESFRSGAPQSDDVTVLLVRRLPGPVGAARILTTASSETAGAMEAYVVEP